MSEIIKPPADWSLHLDLSASDLQTAMGKQRLISIKSYVRSNKRVYAGISVKDTISGVGWTGNMTPTDLRQKVKQAEGRLISLDAFWDASANELRCAGVWIKNTEGWKWNFNVDLEPSDIKAALKKESGKLTCLRVYTRPVQTQTPQRLCAEILRHLDSRRWQALELGSQHRPFGARPEIRRQRRPPGLDRQPHARQLVAQQRESRRHLVEERHRRGVVLEHRAGCGRAEQRVFRNSALTNSMSSPPGRCNLQASCASSRRNRTPTKRASSPSPAAAPPNSATISARTSTGRSSKRT